MTQHSLAVMEERWGCRPEKTAEKGIVTIHPSFALRTNLQNQTSAKQTMRLSHTAEVRCSCFGNAIPIEYAREAQVDQYHGDGMHLPVNSGRCARVVAIDPALTDSAADMGIACCRALSASNPLAAGKRCRFCGLGGWHASETTQRTLLPVVAVPRSIHDHGRL